MNLNDPTGLTTARGDEALDLRDGDESADEFTDASYDPLAGADGGRRMNGGIVIIVAVVLTAGAALFSMRKLAGFTRSIDLDPGIEATIVNFLKSGTAASPEDGSGRTRDDRYASMLDILTERYDEKKVPLRDIRRDPFELALEVKAQPEEKIDLDELNARKRRELETRREERRVEITAASDRLQLKSIMGGAHPMAIIDGEIVHVGELVVPRKTQVEFRVTAIGSASVDLVSEARDLDLSVSVTIYLQRTERD